jgi:peptidoglycan/LPS O-acetylase OafA/YrhL
MISSREALFFAWDPMADGKIGEGRIVSIQVARGVAALLVVLLHASYMVSLPQYVGYIPLSNFFNFGHSGVDFFFVLSGFIIYFIHYRDIGSPLAARRYLWRRLTRIYPIYWIVAAIALAVRWGREPDFVYFINSVLLVPQVKDPFLGPAWTLEHEIFFYLTFLALIINRRLGIAALTVWAAIIAAGIVGVLPDVFLLRFIASPFHLQFFLGMAVALLVIGHTVRVPRLFAAIGTMAFFAVGLCENALLIPPLGALTQTLYGLTAALTVLGLAIAERDGLLTVDKRVGFIGEASYSIYLLNVISIGLTARFLMSMGLMKAIPGWAVMLFTVAVALVSASLLYQFVERPLLKRLYRLGLMHIHAAPPRAKLEAA